jgi:hypothetical protein
MRFFELQISVGEDYDGITASVSTNGFLYLHGRRCDLETVRDAIDAKLNKKKVELDVPVEES